MKERLNEFAADSTSAIIGSGVAANAVEHAHNAVPNGTGLLIILAGIFAPAVKEAVIYLIDTFIKKTKNEKSN